MDELEITNEPISKEKQEPYTSEEAVEELETRESALAFEYRMEAHAEDIVIEDFNPDEPVERNIEQELDAMFEEIMLQSLNNQAQHSTEHKK